MFTTTEEARESRLRRAVRRQGYALRKSRSRTPESYSYGGWAILDPTWNVWVAGMHPMEYTLDLDDVEAWLREDEPPTLADQLRADPDALAEYIRVSAPTA